MPSGSVYGKVVGVKLEESQFLFFTSQTTEYKVLGHTAVLHALNRFAGDPGSQLLLKIENGVEVTINGELAVTIKSPAGIEIAAGSISRAVAFRLIDEAFRSRNDAISSVPWAESAGNNRSILDAMAAFAKAMVRCNLQLETSDGLEINIWPSLKPEIPALDELKPGERFEYDDNRPVWDMKLSIWPMQESRLGLPNPDQKTAKKPVCSICRSDDVDLSYKEVYGDADIYCRKCAEVYVARGGY